MAELQHFLYQFTVGPDPERSMPENWGDAEKAIAEAHWEHLQRMDAEGKIILAGRSLDGEGPAIVIFKAENETEAVAFMQADPFIKEGLFNADLHPFRAALVGTP